MRGPPGLSVALASLASWRIRSAFGLQSFFALVHTQGPRRPQAENVAYDSVLS